MPADSPIEVRDPTKVASPAQAVGFAGRRVRLHSIAKSIAEVRPYIAACNRRTEGLDGEELAAAIKRNSVDPNVFLAAELKARPAAKRAPSTHAEAESVVALLTHRQSLALAATLSFRADMLRQLGPPHEYALLPMAPTLLVPARWADRFYDHLHGYTLLALPMHQTASAPWIAAP